MEKSKGERGQGRRNCGIFMIGICGLIALLNSYLAMTTEVDLTKEYNSGVEFVWATGVIGMSLLISGIAKDVVAIAKHKIVKPA
jgi:hypothetical protein